MRLEKLAKRISIDWVILALAVGFVIYLVIGPLWMLIYCSFRTVGPSEPGPFTLINYRQAYLSPDTYHLLFNTVQFALVSLLVGLPTGVFLAWLVERTNTPLRNAGYAMIPLTIAMPSMLYGIAWLLLLSPNAGVVNIVLMRLFGLTAPPISPYNIIGMGFVEGIRLASSVFLMVVGVFRSMDPALEEAAFTSGANVFRSSRSITFRLMLPGIISAAIYSCTSAFDSFEIPAVLGMPYNIHVFATKIYVASHDIPRDYGMASTLGVLLLIFAAGWVYLYGRSTKRADAYATITGKGYRPRVIDLGKWKYAGTALLLLHFIIVVVAPMAIMLWASLLPVYKIPSIEALARVSLNSYRDIISFPWLGDAIKNTLVVVLSSSTITVILSAVIAWIVVRTRLPGKKLLDVITFLPHGIPGIVLGMAFMWLYLRITFIPIYGTVWIIALAFTARHMAYGTRTMNGAMLQLHQELEEAARMSGASWLQIFSKVTIPLLLPSLISVWIWASMHVTRALSIPIMLYSQNSRIISVLIWDLWQSGEVSTTCAIGVLLMIFLISLLSIGRLVAMRKAREI